MCPERNKRRNWYSYLLIGGNMKVEKLVEIIGSDFYSGVPDSQLKALCNYLMATYGIDP